MTLKELKKMIKEEMNSYVNEEDDLDVATDMDAPEIDVDVDAGDIDVDGSELEGGGSEDVLRGIYDQLAAYFEADAEVEDFDDEALPEEEPEGEDDGDAEEMGENYQEEKNPDEMDEAFALQERFKKLANIIKG
tara:strand:+ start:1141 stop:1542 length:402 start_codon:yes stop_codon:yes gene_type:complete